MTTVLGTALKLAERGIPVLPVDANKRPIAMLVPRGSSDATTNPHAVRNWWEMRPSALLAVATGKRANLVGIDVDPRHGGEDGIEELTGRLGQLPRTVRVSTPSGGWHLWFQHPDGDEIRNSAGTLASGVDIRSAGGFLVAPPSASERGAWEWCSGNQIAELPDEWTTALRERSSDGRKLPEPASTWIGMVRAGTTEGGRNHALTRFVGHLFARDLNAQLTLELAHLVNARNRPPLPDREVDQIVASVAGCEIRRRKQATR